MSSGITEKSIQFPMINSSRLSLKRVSDSYELRGKLRQSGSPTIFPQLSINQEDFKKDEKIVSHFLMKYLERKQQYGMNGRISLTDDSQSFINERDNRIDPRFRRVHLKKIRRNKKQLDTRFLIGYKTNLEY